MEERHSAAVRSILIKEISSARECIYVAMAYFLDNEIADALKAKAKEGVIVDIILSDQTVNSQMITELNSRNINLHFFSYGCDHPFFFNKFCVIDKAILVMGQRGWTYAAAFYDHEEPAVANSEKKLIAEYLAKFNDLKRYCGASRFVHVRSYGNVLKLS